MKIIERIKQLRAKATGGDWSHDQRKFTIEPDVVGYADENEYPVGYHDAQLIVAAINALPALLEVANAASEYAEWSEYNGYKSGHDERKRLISAVAKLRKIQP